MFWKTFLLSALLCAFAIGAEQKDHLFTMTPPEGWEWAEQPGKVSIKDPKTGNRISIQFAAMPKRSPEESNAALKQSAETMRGVFAKSGGANIKEEESKLGGVEARQLSFTQSRNGQTGTVYYIVCFAKELGFTVMFGGPDTNQLAQMKKSVETLKFN
jgi:hypothetical protein